MVKRSFSDGVECMINVDVRQLCTLIEKSFGKVFDLISLEGNGCEL